MGLVYLLFTSITFNFPTLNPVNSENMYVLGPWTTEAKLTSKLRNYTSAAIGVIMFVALITWITTGRHQFTGPPVAIIEGTPQSGSETESTSVAAKAGKEAEAE